jgi:cytosine/adenosine deaminase-related metal-dependent hydrolase
MATLGGASLLGREQDLGRIAPGYQADLTVIQLNRIVWPWVAPDVDPIDLIVLRARASDIDTVIVGGDVMIRDGRPTWLDLEHVGEQLSTQLNTTQLDQETRRVIEEVQPFLEQWYLNWKVPELQGYGQYNSRK